jgi:ABC-type nickel/cobalt efflux system permease component RcnA
VAFALGRGGFDALHESRRIELICYGLIAHRRRAEGLSGHGQRVASGELVLAAGLTPCASAIIILLFALGQGVCISLVLRPHS